MHSYKVAAAVIVAVFVVIVFTAAIHSFTYAYRTHRLRQVVGVTQRRTRVSYRRRLTRKPRNAPTTSSLYSRITGVLVGFVLVVVVVIVAVVSSRSFVQRHARDLLPPTHQHQQAVHQQILLIIIIIISTAIHSLVLVV